MRFKLWHLMLLTLVVALSITVVDVMTYRTVTVQFSSPQIPPALPHIPRLPLPGESADNIVSSPAPSPTCYWLRFEVQDGQRQTDGFLSNHFGYNRLLDRTVTVDNLPNLDGVKVKIRYRYRSAPWAPATELQEEIAKHFDQLLPKVEWHDAPRPDNVFVWVAG